MPELESDYFITEKLTKPLLCRIPFIVFGSYQLLKILKNYGFKTFSPYINETYDEIKNYSQRLHAIINEVERLNNLSENEFNLIFENLNDILDHNRFTLLSLAKARLPIQFINYLINF